VCSFPYNICVEAISRLYKEVKKLADYKKMYAMLFNKITEVIEELQLIQKKTEDLYIESPDLSPELKIIHIKSKSGENDTEK
jgi:hypothetical protein